MTTPHEFSFPFDKAFIHAALKRDFYDKIYQLGGVAAAVFMLAWFLIRPPLDFYVPVALLGLGVIVARVLSLLKRSVAQVHELWTKQAPDGVIRYVLDEQGFEIRLQESHARYEWQGLRRLWRYDDVWIVEIVKNMSVFFPSDAAPAEVREFVVERCEQAGVRV
jgi:hypothetical protein